MSQREQLAPRAAGQLSLSSVYTNHPLTHASVNSIMIYIYFLPFPTAGYHTSIGYHRYEISHGGLQWLTLTDQWWCLPLLSPCVNKHFSTYHVTCSQDILSVKITAESVAMETLRCHGTCLADTGQRWQTCAYLLLWSRNIQSYSIMSRVNSQILWLSQLTANQGPSNHWTWILWPQKCSSHSSKVALFPGPTQLFVTCSTEKQGQPGIFYHMWMM